MYNPSNRVPKLVYYYILPIHLFIKNVNWSIQSNEYLNYNSYIFRIYNSQTKLFKS